MPRSCLTTLSARTARVNLHPSYLKRGGCERGEGVCCCTGVRHNGGNYDLGTISIVMGSICIVRGGRHLYCRFAPRPEPIHNSFTNHLSRAADTDLVWCRQTTTCPRFDAPLFLSTHQPSAGELVQGKLKATAVVRRNPHTTNPNLSCFPLLTSLFPLALSSSLCVFLALPSQLSLIACEVINGFHLTSSTILRRAPTNKTGARLTNCPSEEP